MNEVELLIEDYKRRINTLTNKMYGLNESSKERLKVKKSCYKTFLSELERINKTTNI